MFGKDNPFKNYGKLRIGKIIISVEAFGDLTRADSQSMTFMGSLQPYMLPSANNLEKEIIAISHHFDEICMGDTIPTYVVSLQRIIDDEQTGKHHFTIKYERKDS